MIIDATKESTQDIKYRLDLLSVEIEELEDDLRLANWEVDNLLEELKSRGEGYQ